MYVTLLLIAPAVCEWVEISQQHYRKPLRTHHFQILDKVVEHPEETANENSQTFRKPSRKHSPAIETTKGEEDITSAIPQIQYRKPVRTQYFPADGVTEVYVEEAVTDVTRLNYIKPVTTHYFASDKVTEGIIKETTSDVSYPYSKPTRVHQFPATTHQPEESNKRTVVYLNQSISGTNFWNKGNVNKVPKHGNVQRVQLEKNAIKAPSLTNSIKYPINPDHTIGTNINAVRNASVTVLKQNNSDRTIITSREESQHGEAERIYDETPNSNYNNKKYLPEYGLHETNFKKAGFIGPSSTIKDFTITTNEPKNNVSLGFQGDFTFSLNNPNSPFITDEESFENIGSSKNNKYTFFGDNSYIPTSTTSTIFTSSTQNTLSVEKNWIHNKNLNKSNTNIKEHVPNDFLTKRQPIDEDYATVSDFREEPVTNSRHTPSQSSKEEQSDEMGDETDHINNSIPVNKKTNSMENLMILLREVTNTITRNAKKSVSSKTRYLNKLKETILSSISKYFFQ